VTFHTNHTFSERTTNPWWDLDRLPLNGAKWTRVWSDIFFVVLSFRWAFCTGCNVQTGIGFGRTWERVMSTLLPWLNRVAKLLWFQIWQQFYQRLGTEVDCCWVGADRGRILVGLSSPYLTSVLDVLCSVLSRLFDFTCFSFVFLVGKAP
jgi:hypothetical protein